MSFVKIKYILGKLKIEDPIGTMLYNWHNFDNNKIYDMFGGYFEGGGNDEGCFDEKIYVSYKNEKYLFSRYKDGYYIYYALHQNEKLGEQRCIMIIVETEIHNCNIHDLSYNDKCFAKKNIVIAQKTTGSDLLKLALLLVDKIKDRYKIKTISVQDNSAKFCKPGKRINLGMMLTLLTGHTWYGKYGFLPKDRIKQYQENKKIMDNIQMKDFPEIVKMVKKGFKKYGYTDEGTIDKLYNDNVKIKTFLSFLLDNYDITCEIFYDLYEDLYEKLGLHSFVGKSFIKNI